MKIYLIHEKAIDIEDVCNYIYGAYTDYNKAQRILEDLRYAEVDRRRQAEKCNDCPTKRYYLPNENVIDITKQYCEYANLHQYEDDSVFCDNEDNNFTWYDYTIQELEVDESKE